MINLVRRTSANNDQRRWRRSSRCTPNNNCVELHCTSRVVRVRDSKSGGGPVLRFGRGGWTHFLNQHIR